MTQAQAIAFDAPPQLSAQSGDPKPSATASLKVEVGFSGHSKGTERLSWHGAMPPLPGPGSRSATHSD